MKKIFKTRNVLYSIIIAAYAIFCFSTSFVFGQSGVNNSTSVEVLDVNKLLN